jgi:cell division protein FtsQ
VPASVRRFTARARRNRLRLAAPWLATAGALVALGAAAALVYYTPVLAVERVRVEGATLVTDDEVRAAAMIPLGTPVAQVDTATVHRRVAGLAPVRDVDVRRGLHDVVIRLTERSAVAVVARDERLWLIDAAGVPYTPVTDRPPGLPLVKVATPGPEDSTTRSALTVLAALTPPLRDRLAVLAADAPARIRLELADGRTIIWGDASDNDAKTRVTVVMLGKPGKVIDVSAPDLVTIR